MLALMLFAAAIATAGQPEEDPGYGRELPQGSANLDFVAVNRTGRTIVDIQITPTGEGSPWSVDILTPRDLPNGERGAASYARDIELCRWDVRANFEDGSNRVWRSVDLCETVRVLLR